MLNILWVEDNEIVLTTVRDILCSEGWQVECCTHGLLALSKIYSAEHYDLLLLDNELPGVSGLELTRQARRLAHRREVPIIVISASECGRAAREVGANLFLDKPEGLKALADTIRHLLAASPESV
jgi:CheY-like chemotaxis protein